MPPVPGRSVYFRADGAEGALHRHRTRSGRRSVHAAHTTLTEAERYTREADRRRGGKRAVTKLNEHRKNKTPQTAPESLGKITKTERKSEW